MKRLVVLGSSALLLASVLTAPVAADAASAGEKPAVTGLVSHYGATVGYAHVVVEGRRFTGHPRVTFGNNPAARVRVLSPTRLVAYAPDHAHGVVQVRVTTAAGTSPTSDKDRYTYVHQVQPGTWQARTAPLPSGEPADDYESRATSCPTTTTCYSVGVYSTSDDDNYLPAPFVATRTSSGETTERAPLPDGVAAAGTTLYLISCPAVGSCVAAGQYDDGHHAFVLVLANGTWTPSTVDLHEGSGSAEIHGLSCGAPGECTAVGYQSDDDGAVSSHSPVLVRLHDGAWTTTDVRVPASGRATLDHVDCASADYCLAAGSYGGGTPRFGTYVVQTVGGARSVRALPASSTNGQPSDVGPVRCPAVDRCTLLVDFAGGRDNTSAFVSVRDGSRFTFSPIVFPADVDLANTLFADQATMSCPAVSVCFAAGEYGVSSGFGAASVARLTGTTVRVYNLPDTGSGVEVYGIDCATTTACTAVGATYRAGSGTGPGETLGAFFTFANTVWTVQAASAAPGQRARPTLTRYLSVDCPAAGACVANGDYLWDVQQGSDDGFPYEYYARDSGLVALETLS